MSSEPKTLQRTLTRATPRKQQTCKLPSSGNFVIRTPVAQEILDGAEYPSGEEFVTTQYTACTCDPDEYTAKGYNLRIKKLARDIEIFVVVTMYNEDEFLFNRTMFALAQNIKYLCQKEKYGWSRDSWKKVAVCIVADGRTKVNDGVLKVLETMGVYQDSLAQSKVDDKEVQAHIYEYTAQRVLDEKLRFWGAAEGIPPIQTIFCMKEKNAKKINSHRWFFNAFASTLNPEVCVLLDVGTKPDAGSLYNLWKAFFRNDQIAGACGEIRADLGSGIDYFKNLCNPLVASQNFEYKISNILDKSLESVFGYISVLPGAFSAYRFSALQNTGPGVGPLAKYFEGEARVGQARDNSLFSANLYLAEDRILCFELVSKKDSRWTLHYVRKAHADTDVPDSVPEFLSQRRRWLNGSMFAGFYAMAHISRMWQTKHSFARKIAFTIQFFYNVINQIFSWFILGNFATTFFFLFQQLQQLLDMSTDTTLPSIQKKIISVIINVAALSYPVVLVSLFIVSFGNRPQAFHRVYKYVMMGFGVIGAAMIVLLVVKVTGLNVFSYNQTRSDYDQFFQHFGQVTQSWNSTSDTGELLLGAVLERIREVYSDRVYDNLQKSQFQSYTYIATLASTFGVFLVGSIIQGDVAHMFTCLIQYLLLLPSFINVLTVYALSNLHDVSWGTKGDSKAEALPQASTKTVDGKIVADVSIGSNAEDVSARYADIIRELVDKQNAPKEAKQKVVLSQEDEYKGFRTWLMLIYIASNGLLFAISINTSSDLFFLILLSTIAGISSMKLLGAIVFAILRVFTELSPFGRSQRQRKAADHDHDHDVEYQSVNSDKSSKQGGRGLFGAKPDGRPSYTVSFGNTPSAEPGYEMIGRGRDTDTESHRSSVALV
ncbi:glycosyltransferase family 2 protein [Polychytrium aggregatum]|uniref:glycosyltransferase family 2 protein n=1 Tax=Polychytrium aggregatum TaxID=110093 RepID=UPI0022FDFA4B|nr:glycosyltransferase family 2 protein [Polychytrium aggregatum]KAI9208366.1 glycosyltransferase family 2 protein [Polychytrium aggregatum]